MSIGVMLLSVFFVSFLFLLAAFIFFACYRRLPFAIATIREVSVTEKAMGNAVILTTWIHYEVFGKSRYKTVVFSGYTGRRDRLHAKAKQIRDLYKSKQIKYHHLPGLSGVGVLERSITREYLWAYGLLTAIFGMLSAVAFYWEVAGG